jgi:hypothetical protein
LKSTHEKFRDKFNTQFKCMDNFNPQLKFMNKFNPNCIELAVEENVAKIDDIKIFN